MIDDLLPQANWPDGHGANVEALLERLKQRVDLQMTRLDWSTGIAIVTRRRAGDRML